MTYRSVSVIVITHTFVGLKCLTETKIQILCYHVDYTRFHIVDWDGMLNGSTFVSPHCWTNNVRQFDPSLTYQIRSGQRLTRHLNISNLF